METLEQQKIDMPKYISKKLVRARPMNELEAVNLGYARPNDDHHEWREGYYVLYPDGYRSWCPKDVFEKSNKKAETAYDLLMIEHDELSERLGKLRKFIHHNENFKKLPKIEQVFLISQYGAMQAYQGVLLLRIESMSPLEVESKEK